VALRLEKTILDRSIQPERRPAWAQWPREKIEELLSQPALAHLRGKNAKEHGRTSTF
jgi:hypothetical protein